MKFEWSDKLSVNDIKIDSQHRYLITLGNEIDNLDIKKAKQTIMLLYKYTREHFASEELHMKQMHYTALKEHTQIHNDLISKLNEIVEHNINTTDDITKFKEFFKTWITDHIMGEDMKYSLSL